jgi:WD40-like Beta Propeller Repeat
VRRELERIEIPGEHEARERAWSVVRTAYEERERVPRPRSRLVPVLVAAGVALAIAAASTPPGRAVLDDVRDAVLPTRVERAQPALFSLPAPGRVLAVSDAGAWVVQRDGSRRLLGRYEEASWSPFGRFVVTSRRNELAALEPNGDVRWSLARPDVRFPRWGGTRADTRIAYVSDSQLRVVSGDGTDDHRLARRAADVAVAWRPGPAHVLAYVRRDGFLRVVDADQGTVLMKTPARGATHLEWVADRLLALSPREVRLFDDSGRLVQRRQGRYLSAALAPRAQAIALVRLERGAGIVEVLQRSGGSARRLFAGGGRFSELAWSPDGRWLLAGWPTADQWLLVRAAGRPRIQSVSNVSAQLRSESFPRIEGWCCAR